jgi:hypothetical protein
MQLFNVSAGNRSSSEYVVSNTACFCINDYFLGHISILCKITKQLGRPPGKNTLFFDKRKSDIPKFTKYTYQEVVRIHR